MRSSNNEDIVPVGRITGAHGIKGEVRLQGYSPLDDLELESIFLTGPRAGIRTGDPVIAVAAHERAPQAGAGMKGLFGSLETDIAVAKGAHAGPSLKKTARKEPPKSNIGDAGPFRYEVTRARLHKGHFIIELDGVTDRNTAEALVGCEVSVRKDDLPELDVDEFYHTELIGMEVLTDDGKRLGRITEILPTGSNDVFVVKGAYGEVLVPSIEASKIKIDRAARSVTVHLLEGLLPDEKP